MSFIPRDGAKRIRTMNSSFSLKLPKMMKALRTKKEREIELLDPVGGTTPLTRISSQRRTLDWEQDKHWHESQCL